MLSATSHLVFFLLVSQCLSQVAATESPIIFIGTGEHIDDFEPFNVRSFVSRLLGMGDLSGLVEKMKDTNMGDQTEMIKRMTQGQFSLRDMQEQFKNVLKMGSYVYSFALGPLFHGSEGIPTPVRHWCFVFSTLYTSCVCAFCVRRRQDKLDYVHVAWLQLGDDSEGQGGGGHRAHQAIHHYSRQHECGRCGLALLTEFTMLDSWHILTSNLF